MVRDGRPFKLSSSLGWVQPAAYVTQLRVDEEITALSELLDEGQFFDPHDEPPQTRIDSRKILLETLAKTPLVSESAPTVSRIIRSENRRIANILQLINSHDSEDEDEPKDKVDQLWGAVRSRVLGSNGPGLSHQSSQLFQLADSSKTCQDVVDEINHMIGEGQTDSLEAWLHVHDQETVKSTSTDLAVSERRKGRFLRGFELDEMSAQCDAILQSADTAVLMTGQRCAGKVEQNTYRYFKFSVGNTKSHITLRFQKILGTSEVYLSNCTQVPSREKHMWSIVGDEAEVNIHSQELHYRPGDYVVAVYGVTKATYALTVNMSPHPYIPDITNGQYHKATLREGGYRYYKAVLKTRDAEIEVNADTFFGGIALVISCQHSAPVKDNCTWSSIGAGEDAVVITPQDHHYVQRGVYYIGVLGVADSHFGISVSIKNPFIESERTVFISSRKNKQNKQLEEKLERLRNNPEEMRALEDRCEKWKDLKIQKAKKSALNVRVRKQVGEVAADFDEFMNTLQRGELKLRKQMPSKWKGATFFSGGQIQKEDETDSVAPVHSQSAYVAPTENAFLRKRDVGKEMFQWSSGRASGTHQLNNTHASMPEWELSPREMSNRRARIMTHVDKAKKLMASTAGSNGHNVKTARAILASTRRRK